MILILQHLCQRRLEVFAASLFTIFAESLLVRTNGLQGLVFPLYVVLAFVLLADLGNTLRAGQRISAAFAVALVVIGLSMTLQMFFVHLRSLALLTTTKPVPV
jgi:hypothetical protein